MIKVHSIITTKKLYHDKSIVHHDNITHHLMIKSHYIMTEVHRNIKLVVWCHDKSPFRSEKPISSFGPVQLLTILTLTTSLILFNFGNLYLFKTYLKIKQEKKKILSKV